MDGILSIGVTGLVDKVLATRNSHATRGCDIDASMLAQLDDAQNRDLLLLAACYDQSTAETYSNRWSQLRKKLGISSLRSWIPFATGLGVTLLVVLLVTLLIYNTGNELMPWWVWVVIAVAGWGPWLVKSIRCFWKAHRIVSNVRVGNRERLPLCQLLTNFTMADLASQPLPMHPRTDDRYEMQDKFFGILKSMNVTGLVIVVDRVDEPNLINGSPEMMRLLLWPMLDNKFLKQPGIGVKLLLPVELQHFIERESKEFYQRARLDKQNMIPSLQWTSEALYDVANARLKAVSEGQGPNIMDLLDDSISQQRVFEAFRALRVPRHLFKFLYRLLVNHCNNYTDQDPGWKISSQTFESTLAVYLKEQDAFDRGTGAG
jgi:hypothetical protein